MVALHPSHERLEYTAADIRAESASEISLCIGSHDAIQIVQTYNKQAFTREDTPFLICITDQQRSLTVYVQPLYLP